MRGNKALNKTIISALLLLTTVLVIPPSTYSASLSASEQLTDSSNVVSSGDGLYVDEYETGRYVYKGANPNNFIRFNDELWRIVAVEADGSLKIIRSSHIGTMVFDTANTRVADYCSAPYWGCNVWGSSSTMLDSSGNNITTAARQAGGQEYALPDTEAYINTYLNTTYYNSLGTDKKYIDSHLFNVGVVSHKSDQTLNEDTIQEHVNKWRGKVGLLNPTDFVKASTSQECVSVYSAHSWGGALCSTNSYVTTLLSVNSRLMNPIDGPITGYPDTQVPTLIAGMVYSATATGAINSHYAGDTRAIYPVAYLTFDTCLSGTGTSSDPYEITSIACGPSNVTVGINSALALSQDNDDLVLSPVPNGETAKEDVVVSVSTNDVVGYRLVMSIAEDSSNSGGSGSNTSLNYLNPINSGDSFSIPSTASMGELVANAWGYNLGEVSATTTFKPIPSFATPDTLKTASGLALDDTTAVTFGAKVNLDIPAGSYRNTVQFTAIANI